MAQAVIKDATINSVWEDSFTGREGNKVEFFRALVQVAGEAPCQLNVSKEDYPNFKECIGMSGDLGIEIDARPGNKQRVFLKYVG